MGIVRGGGLFLVVLQEAGGGFELDLGLGLTRQFDKTLTQLHFLQEERKAWTERMASWRV